MVECSRRRPHIRECLEEGDDNGIGRDHALPSCNPNSFALSFLTILLSKTKRNSHCYYSN